MNKLITLDTYNVRKLSKYIDKLFPNMSMSICIDKYTKKLYAEIDISKLLSEQN